MSRKEEVARETRRVLKRRGKFVLTDTFLREGGAKETQGQTTIIPCPAAAQPLNEQTKLFREVGFGDLYIEDHSQESTQPSK